MISGGPIAAGTTRNSQKAYVREVINKVGESSKHSKSKMMLEFGDPDLEGLKFTQDDPLVITPVIGNSHVMRVLVDNGASVDYLFHDTFIRMGYNNSQLTPSDTPIYGFNHVECKVEGAIQLPITIREEPREAMQMLNFQVLPIEDMDVRENDELRGKPAKDLVPIPFDSLDPEKVTYIEASLDKPLKGQMLNVDPTRKVVQQKKRTYAPDRLEAIKQEVEKLLEAGFIKKVQFLEWLANPVMVKKANGKWRVCIDFSDLNDACPKDYYPTED
ncbi:uncharacterized protein LOC141701163 [Apium graveolens]|uniref:uncharacterized protein LOC141701163 n=1 Tax=Apium graveolens TaxID=4045 RepID=UPI003D7B2A31